MDDAWNAAGWIAGSAALAAIAWAIWLQRQAARLPDALARAQRAEDEAARMQAAAQDAVARAAELAARVAGKDAVAVALADERDRLQAELAAVRGGQSGSERRVAELEARLQEQQQAAADRLRDLESARERMRVEFQALAGEILEDKAKRFSAQNAEQIGSLLTPLRDEIGGFRKLVSDSYEKEGLSRAALQTELKQLLDLNRRLSDDATSLTRALTSDNRTQGYWGELKLERLLESAGLEKGKQYLTQESFRDAEGDRYRPDAVLLLPEGRHIVIDAKMNLVDYQRACDCSDTEERETHFDRHASAMRAHVIQLGRKDYGRLVGLNTPDLVFLFVPVEAAFLEALRRDPRLYNDAFDNKIMLAGPGNLLASLHLVAHMWRTENQNRNAKAIAERAALLYDKFVGFAEDMQRVGDALRKADDAHKDALGKLSQGRGNLVRQAEMLRDLGAAPSKKMPAQLQDLTESAGEDEP